jgi:hypothetical protein
MTATAAALRAHYGAHLSNFFDISLKNRYLYVQTPKVATSTISRRLIKLELTDTPIKQSRVGLHPRVTAAVHVKPYQLPDALLEEVVLSGKYLRFCFVRHPYSRVLSAYLDKIVSRERPSALVYAHFDRSYSDPEHTVSFAEFLAYLQATLDRRDAWDPHWRPMTSILRPDLVPYDEIGKIETFEEDFQRINLRLGGILPVAASATPHRTDAARKVDEIYTGPLRETVRAIYGADFEAFGYKR